MKDRDVVIGINVAMDGEFATNKEFWLLLLSKVTLGAVSSRLNCFAAKTTQLRELRNIHE
ncbi:hypothetical protein BKE30_08355 [Alkanindiges hydrocarboniclasticus]|jgi:hypothetical protein|uniref:Uncharacterized protein n=1 Tax=Alkanindiges hydrocarboniclasticus TaxID=1907941 RepID=A0A1S8CVH5_9GAMM|nr:hypothetical protein BKE30_08355 [Alkanindiges hydrocarboniclasticus]